ncbi:MAG TPA: DUF5666 domain-containing protein [Acidimicrobiales bacterium]|nr:DUF5666 domain-containing protein [Acidimicrobiales bacterium]
MSNVEHGGSRRSERVLAAVALCAALFAGCSRAATVEVSASAPLPAAPLTTAAGPTETFQGALAAVDVSAEELVVDVQIVWAPVLKADRHQRTVTVGPHTSWEPGGTALAVLRVGDEVQVEAVSGPDGTWDARQVQLFDID